MADLIEPARCRTCNARIVWAKLDSEKRIPLNYTRVRTYEIVEGVARPVLSSKGDVRLAFVSHFVSCPDAAQHSKPKPLS